MYSLEYLVTLRLNNNQLKNFVYDANKGSANLILLNNNNLTFTNQETCPIKFTPKQYRLSMFLSNNQINDLNSLRCLLNNSNVVHLDLSYNNIDTVALENFKFGDGENRANGLTLNLDNNEISEIEFFEDDEEAEIDSLASYDAPLIEIDVSNNPIVCDDCNMFKIQKSTTKLDIPFSRNGLKIKFGIGNDTCLDTLYCSSMDIFEKVIECPHKCKCTTRRLDKRLFIECLDANLTEFPKLPLYNDDFVGDIDIDVSRNAITKLNFINEDLSRIKSIYAENNSITHISFQNYPANIENLFLANNKLEKLDNALTTFLVSRRDNVWLKLGSNPWLCDNDGFDYSQFQQQLKSSIQDKNAMQCKNIEINSSSDVLKSSVKFLLTIVVLCVLVVAGFYVYKRYPLPRDFHFNFNHLRSSQRQSELHEGLIE